LTSSESLLLPPKAIEAGNPNNPLLPYSKLALIEYSQHLLALFVQPRVAVFAHGVAKNHKLCLPKL
jgi:hypothetical protein